MEWKSSAGDILGELQEAEKLGVDLSQEEIHSFTAGCGPVFSLACC